MRLVVFFIFIPPKLADLVVEASGQCLLPCELKCLLLSPFELTDYFPMNSPVAKLGHIRKINVSARIRRQAPAGCHGRYAAGVRGDHILLAESSRAQCEYGETDTEISHYRTPIVSSSY